MTFDDYVAIDAVNISSLLQMSRSPAHYRHALQPGAGRDTAALTFGRLAHMAILEPERYATDVAVWTGKVRRGKEFDAWSEANADKVQATMDDHLTCLAMSTAVHEHPAAGPYMRQAAAVEQTIRWRHRLGVDCKARLDWFSEATPLVIDLKTTRDACDLEFGRAAARYEYHTRAAFYADAYKSQYGVEPAFVLIAVEKEPPFAVAAYRVGEQAIETGRRRYEGLLSQLKLCRERDEWPGICGDTETELVLPEWAYMGDNGLDLVVDGETISV